jgi:hypothetical protein
MLPTAVVYAPGFVVNEAVGAVRSIITEFDETAAAKLPAVSRNVLGFSENTPVESVQPERVTV